MQIINRAIAKIVKHAIRAEEKERYSRMSIGQGSNIGIDCDINPPGNVIIGDYSSIGARSTIWSTRAKVIIGNYVITGPQITIISGNHVIDCIGKHISEFNDSDKDKLPGIYDADIIIDDGVWIGANATILSGVHIAEGCVIAAGAVVSKDTVPYGVYGGVPAKLIKMRFSDDKLTQHIQLLKIHRTSNMYLNT